MRRHAPARVIVRSSLLTRKLTMRRFRAAICLLAFSTIAPSTIAIVQGADPVRAPGVSDPADSLSYLVDQAIAVTRQRNLDFQVHTPWQILHGLLALRNNYTVKNGAEFVNALDYISTTARFKGERWFERAAKGAKAHPYNGTPYDFEGHVNQSLAIIAMCDLPLTHQFTLADGTKATMADMVRQAQWGVTTKEETTWTLWFLTHYIDQDAQWTNFEGEQWSMERLVRIQNAASTYNAPCGGCHSLFALAYARNAYMQKHGKLQGAWLEADQKLQQYINAARSMMNRDGSFATQYFKARGFSYDFNERIASSGHMIEWMMLALPRKRLDESWLRLGVQTLANDLIRNASQPADCGPLYHSLHALILYKQRINMNTAPEAAPELADQQKVNAGALTLSKPDGESMPLSAQEMKNVHPSATADAGSTEKTKAASIDKPAVTASAEPKTVTPGTSLPTVKPDEKVPEIKEEKPVSTNEETGVSLKPVTTTSAPVLTAPSTGLTPARKSAQVAEETSLKKLSGSDENAKESTKQANEAKPTVDARPSLAPIPGGMPLYVPAADRKEMSSSEKKSASGNDVKADTKPAATDSDSPKTTQEGKSVSGSFVEPKLVAQPANAKEVNAKVDEAAAAAQPQK